MTQWPDHIAGQTTHARYGAIANSFRYGVDYVLIDPRAENGPLLFSRNRFNLLAVHDRNHGGAPRRGAGLPWAEQVFADAGLKMDGITIRLLTQPSYLGHIFNPVSFWLAFRGTALHAVIAEVSNTFGDRHSYVCHKPEFTAIAPSDKLQAKKIFHVSPFQQIAGDYWFNFDIGPRRIAIRIDHKNGDQGVIATLTGARQPLSNTAVLGASLRRPAGTLRTVALIYWQALKLKLKGASYRPRPTPPEHEVS
ncbi:DUF1365 domain-containing protein [Phaeobacter inhibens]|uniref:DUF1365 domain-containing protein n=1 Tax=Phaeobacter inhibens TaxID=221822 RepID=UPI0021A74B21|nr:DUF1365 domain-containing protein [Phaeobacter inhibens]UWR59884.1 DUF1365 domain-containing protein [Phaeobacter inhibens]UWR75516.1 DUF1365 domain-containing protein [Phaeobacter inhibens]UWR79496.1 DUF1365 domain-containing protein [Phaeobacter inhibens]UWR95368.1 DUF1365 domain-containing protein [Phaeobacter inhibens]